MLCLGPKISKIVSGACAKLNDLSTNFPKFSFKKPILYFTTSKAHKWKVICISPPFFGFPVYRTMHKFVEL